MPREMSEGERFEPRFMMVKVEQLHNNNLPVRMKEKPFGEEFQELGQSLKELKVPLQNLVIRHSPGGKGYEIICGERRYRAARAAGLKEVPALLIDAQTDEEIRQLQLIENVHRRDLTPLELAQALKIFINPNDYSESVRKICALIKKSPIWVEKVLGLTDKLTKTAKEEAQRWPIPLSILYEAALLPKEQQAAFVRRVRTESLSITKARQIIRQERLKPEREVGEKEQKRLRGYVGGSTITIPIVNGTVTIKLRKSNFTYQEATLALEEALRYIYRHSDIKPPAKKEGG